MKDSNPTVLELPIWPANHSFAVQKHHLVMVL